MGALWCHIRGPWVRRGLRLGLKIHGIEPPGVLESTITLLTLGRVSPSLVAGVEVPTLVSKGHEMRRIWDQVREVAAQKYEAKSQAVHLWLTPVDGQIPLNEAGFPVGIALRPVSDKLAELGFCNGKGQKFHPYQLQEMIFEELSRLMAGQLRLRCSQPMLFPELEETLPTEEHVDALREAIILGCRHKRRFDQVSDEEVCRREWRTLKRPVKRQIPWDEKKQKLEKKET